MKTTDQAVSHDEELSVNLEVPAASKTPVAPVKKTRDQVVNQVAADAAIDAQEYLDEVVVPGGGE